MSILRQAKDLAKLALPKPLVNQIQSWLALISVTRRKGFSFYLNSPDRFVLEDAIIPYIVKCNEFHKILFVGSDWYTKPYNRYFKNKEYWTIEINPNRKKFGSKRHVVDSLLNLSQHFAPGNFDLIVYNGVFGHGIDSKEATEISFQQCFQCLRPGGMLVFGWNDVTRHKPFPVIEECQNLRQFEPVVFSPLATSQYLVAESSDRHVFNFYQKPLPVVVEMHYDTPLQSISKPPVSKLRDSQSSTRLHQNGHEGLKSFESQ
jgi:hypothetical protein